MKHFNPTKIDLSQRGISKVLGELESSIMSCFWDCKQVTARDVLDCLNGNHGKSLTFSSVNTVINRMVKKGLLKKKKEGSYYFYKPVLSKEKFAESVNQEIFNTLVNDKEMFAVSSFIDLIDKLPKKQREVIKRYFKSK